VKFVRAGNQFTVHWAAFRRYSKQLKGRFDLVVDEVNTIPFFTPLWADVPSVMFIHQLAREVWWYESKFPISAVGFLAEPLYLRRYRHVPVITVSESTKRDLLQLGFHGPVSVIPEGIQRRAMRLIAGKPPEPRFLYAGRLAPSKRPADVIRAFAQFQQRYPSASLRLLGDGAPRYLQSLHDLVARLGITRHVQFLGRVTTMRKQQEMAAAHALLLASAREGWGLVVTEANAFGTPAIGYNVPGLRDSIRNNQTGLLVSPTPEALAGAMTYLWEDQALYQRFSAAANEWSATFTFDDTAREFRKGLESVVSRTTAAELEWS
jgi:glycosyltransferase involved in cell wall biosynthesis